MNRQSSVGYLDRQWYVTEWTFVLYCVAFELTLSQWEDNLHNMHVLLVKYCIPKMYIYTDYMWFTLTSPRINFTVKTLGMRLTKIQRGNGYTNWKTVREAKKNVWGCNMIKSWLVRSSTFCYKLHIPCTHAFRKHRERHLEGSYFLVTA